MRWGWTVGTSVPAELIEAALLDYSALLAAAAFVSIGLGVLLAFLLWQRLQRPLTALGASARRPKGERRESALRILRNRFLSLIAQIA